MLEIERDEISDSNIKTYKNNKKKFYEA